MYEKMFRRRNSLRLKDFNYKSACVYFVTVCVNRQLCLFGEVNDRKLKLNDAGKMIAQIFTNLPKYYNNMIAETYIVMPNHFHGIIIIDHSVGAPLRGRPDTNVFTQEFKIHNLLKREYFYRNISEKKDQMFQNKGRAQRPAPTGDHLSLGDIVGRFKSYTTLKYISGMEINNWKPFYEKLWQRGYYDHIIRNENELFAIRKYIVNNPLNWKTSR
jgi:REP element-mobilizing transposase RayT